MNCDGMGFVVIYMFGIGVFVGIDVDFLFFDYSLCFYDGYDGGIFNDILVVLIVEVECM